VDLIGASALVIGGAGGFGEATVRTFVDAGIKVVVADVADEKGKALSDELGEGVEYVHTDVTSDEAIDEAIDRARALAPLRVAVIVNGGPGGASKRIVSRSGDPLPMAEFIQTTEYYYIATYRAVSRTAAAMSRNEPLADNQRGVVITTASIAGFEGQVGQTAYAMAKGGVIGLTITAARDLAPAGIRVMSIAPGTFLTPAYNMTEEEANAKWGPGVPNPKRMGRPSEYAHLALGIAENDYLNGTVIRIDGALRFSP
jgi:NAD(P)-dependent dehydrogenase (short-subunit alcohol dehydrogenase family)